MKHTGLILVFSLLAAIVAAQDDVPWKLLVYPMGPSSAERDVTDFIREGFLPVGLEVEPGESMSILLLRSPQIEVNRWAIIEYEDWNAFEEDVTASINEGFVPMDLTHYDGKLAILWIESALEIAGWRIQTSAPDVTTRTRTINDRQAQGFNLRGLSMSDGLMWYLFLSQEELANTAAVSFFTKDTESFRSGVVAANENGWLPVALAISEESFVVGFVR